MKHTIKVHATITIDERDVDGIRTWNSEMINRVIEEITSIEYRTKIKDNIRINISIPVPTTKEIFDCVNKG